MAGRLQLSMFISIQVRADPSQPRQATSPVTNRADGFDALYYDVFAHTIHPGHHPHSVVEYGSRKLAEEPGHFGYDGQDVWSTHPS